ncbi:hypothetical protein FA95DRAFT_560804 [Auriscalpium vulgare]|uniref:Uncharacterized protein n=1 Tax=Auriscalpium vulgare TaxID=40419 RepID=A0ACB8RG10_9AGAM|nr:hypothetical protein FA95DRAFT_560804 [Auriscalpium vulgare]
MICISLEFTRTGALAAACSESPPTLLPSGIFLRIFSSQLSLSLIVTVRCANVESRSRGKMVSPRREQRRRRIGLPTVPRKRGQPTEGAGSRSGEECDDDLIPRVSRSGYMPTRTSSIPSSLGIVEA